MDRRMGAMSEMVDIDISHFFLSTNYSTLDMLRNMNWSLPLVRDRMDRLWSFRYVILRISNILLYDDGLPL